MPMRIFSKVSVFAVIIDSKIDKSSAVCMASNVYNSTIGRYSYVGRHAFINRATIGSFCSIASGVTIGGAAHPIHWASTSPIFHAGRSVLKKKFSEHIFDPYARTEIGNDVWIANNVLIKSGIKIANGAVIGMGAVVTKDVGPYEVWAGNPARMIKKRFDDETIERLNQTQWWESPDKDIAVYAESINDVDRFIKKINGDD